MRNEFYDGFRVLEITTFSLCGKGRFFNDSKVLRPMMTTFFAPYVVIYLKCCKSDFSFQGRPPLRPIPPLCVLARTKLNVFGIYF